jgi:hypothetical protein
MYLTALAREYRLGLAPRREDFAWLGKLRKKEAQILRRGLESARDRQRAVLNELLVLESVHQFRRTWSLWSDEEDRRYERQFDTALGKLWPGKTCEERRQVAEWARKIPSSPAGQEATP